ncbi:MAG TPA: bifunctional riboflavin kinase/FAD synthetase [Burkholderiaceae bacterium]|nr:bifunctional riboflavin kinase/FAD synthetase [Burkholderiaceae bacterium]
MQVFRRLPPPAQRRPCALAIGNFDGVHLGHRALLRELGLAARRLGVPTCVLTFDPHPREFFAGRRPGVVAPARIATLRDKLEALAEAGVDRVCVAHFNERLASLEAEAFVDRVIVDGLRARFVMVGDDFRFGAQRRGDFAMLERLSAAHGFELRRMSTVALDGQRISSSAVRESLAAADFERVERLLGRPYAISGHVVHGRKLGRELGFPTLNLRIPHGRPALGGIFVVRVHGLADRPLPGVASLGTRPAVETGGAPLLETHVLDWQGDAYGRVVRIEFLRKLRDEAHYDGLDALVAQIRRDADAARAHFAALAAPPPGAGSSPASGR